jgi:pimeloyl-ACP methyl ester carboxylesterase
MRILLIAAVTLSLWTPVVVDTSLHAQPPLVFVHGNGDHAGLWDTTIWRFETNGYRADRLFAVDLPHPLGGARYNVPERNRSTPEEQTAALAAFVTRVMLQTGEKKVVLVGSSRGGMTIRNYLRFGGGAAHVSHAILSGAPNHGVFALPTLQPESEFNGAAPYLRALNDSSEVVDGVRFLTIRSDNNDKFAQADGAALGMAGVATGVDARGPALRGAADVVLNGADHREVAFSDRAFAAMYEFMTGVAPRTRAIAADSVAILSGLISGTDNGGPTNTPLVGATIQVFAVDSTTGARVGGALHSETTNFSGRWGPFRASPTQFHEFVLTAPDSSTLYHVFRSPIPRSSRYINFRIPNVPAPRGDSTQVSLVRPRGYLGAGRDTVLVNGAPARGIPPGVATVDRVGAWWSANTPQSITFRFNGETIVVQTRPNDPRRVIVAEIQHD